MWLFTLTLSIFIGLIRFQVVADCLVVPVLVAADLVDEHVSVDGRAHDHRGSKLKMELSCTYTKRASYQICAPGRRISWALWSGSSWTSATPSRPLSRSRLCPNYFPPIDAEPSCRELKTSLQICGKVTYLLHTPLFRKKMWESPPHLAVMFRPSPAYADVLGRLRSKFDARSHTHWGT